MPTHDGLSTQKRFFFGSIVLLLTILAAEALAFLMISIQRRESFSWKAAGAERDRILNEAENLLESSSQVIHPYLGYVFRPPEIMQLDHFGQRRRDPVSEFGFPYTSQRPVQKRTSERIIIGILGGSVAANFFDIGRHQFEVDLRQAGIFRDRELLFVNLAMGGYKQPQQLLVVSYLLALGAEFDVLINIDGFNEVALHEANNATKGVFPAFPRSWYSLATSIPDHSLRSLIGEAALLRQQRKGLAASFSAAPIRYSVIAHQVWRFLDARNRRGQNRVSDEFRETRAVSADYAATGPDAQLRSTEELYGFLVDLWARASLQLDRLCRANGIRYYHFLHPNQYVQGSKTLTASEKKQAFLETHPYRRGVDRGYPGLRDAGPRLRQGGVNFVDLTQIFLDQDEPLYIDSCCHFNRLGNEIMGQQMARAIANDLTAGE